jgi:hypothetical protein
MILMRWTVTGYRDGDGWLGMAQDGLRMDSNIPTYLRYVPNKSTTLGSPLE